MTTPICCLNLVYKDCDHLTIPYGPDEMYGPEWSIHWWHHAADRMAGEQDTLDALASHPYHKLRDKPYEISGAYLLREAYGVQ